MKLLLCVFAFLALHVAVAALASREGAVSPRAPAQAELPVDEALGWSGAVIAPRAVIAPGPF